MSNKKWDYRVIRNESKDGSDEWYSVQEVYYDEDGKPGAQSIDLMVEGDTITGMRTQLEQMLKSLDEPVLEERDITPTLDDRYDSKGYTKEHTKQWLDSLYEQNNKFIDTDAGSTKNEMVLEDDGCNTQQLISKNESYIYESPDGGQTIYRRKFGKTEKEKI